MAPGERNKFGVPIFEPEVFRKQMFCFEKSVYESVSQPFEDTDYFRISINLRGLKID